jgi:hypothetical protein
MIIIWGQRMYGRCDEVGDLFYVRTRFFHVWFIPLIPVQTFIVLKGTESHDGFKGVPASMSMKSVLYGWLRAGLVIAAIVGIFWAVVSGIAYGDKGEAEDLVGAVFGAVLAGGSVLLYWLSARFARASYERALEIADQLGLSHEIIEQVYAIGSAAEAYGAGDSDADYAQEAEPGDTRGSGPTYEDDRWRE